MKPGYTCIGLVYKFILSPLRELYVKVFRPRELGVRCLVVYNDEILLVRNTYGSMNWNMPGGLVGDGELPETASRRETEEEVGVSLRNLKPLGVKGTTYYFYGEAIYPRLEIARGEIYDAQWFAWDSLPSPLSPEVITVRRLHQWM